MDTLLCSNKQEAEKAIDNIGGQYIHDWEFLENGKVKLYLEDGWKDGADKN